MREVDHEGLEDVLPPLLRVEWHVEEEDYGDGAVDEDDYDPNQGWNGTGDGWGEHRLDVWADDYPGAPAVVFSDDPY
jgi:hypothetical protein